MLRARSRQVGDCGGRRPGAVRQRLPAPAQEVVLVPNRVIYPGETVDLSALREVVLKPGKVGARTRSS